MILTPIQIYITIGMVTLGTMITRFLPFLLFQNSKRNSSYIDYLGKVLPYSAIGLLVVYCLKEVNILRGSYGIPEAIAILCIVILHYKKGNTLLSIGVGTLLYMLLVQLVFV